ncbi:Crp/Fnr family transcriptional regulator [Listeria monocytogenes]|uniref:Crp/Fnr family transcriptional regulator n=1 Tax=Listeria monocytogenes serotype 1/2a TaxID=1906951 RepID=A0A9P2DRC2_LISMN|nr:Crp/Fnr family transcriptional regulator [Listeria monocytogenes]EAF3075168.1 Crp/Fnr family transcriptional regulator [Listeria monocytogenes serotype 1/2a]EAF4522664.1 Crp/Fnr family transcriptional regulator [Listeria monocytogenes serotype 4b]EHC6165298.1 Crp/Fnr family transcriptional regulator [Listeria monocytogenes serotype 1/2b]EAC5135635.1 Crp/Fnr family transcriptional regulator [Listeria monocytogenes]EAD0095972.1 Crp/Fnr family transcriptional regulator [Listeria monocytogenes]
MDALFNYKEFVRLSHEGNINYEKLKVPKHTELVDTFTTRNTHVYLIVEGFVSISMNPQLNNIYTVLGKGSFVNYYSLFQGSVDSFLFTTISPCTIYKYSFKDLEYFLSMFPENFGFQFFIMRDLARHAFFKSLFAETSSSDKLELSFSNLCKLHGALYEKDSVILPKELRTSTIAAYSNLSKSSFYKQLSLLKEQGKIWKNGREWVVRSKELYDYVKAMQFVD